MHQKDSPCLLPVVPPGTTKKVLVEGCFSYLRLLHVLCRLKLDLGPKAPVLGATNEVRTQGRKNVYWSIAVNTRTAHSRVSWQRSGAANRTTEVLGSPSRCESGNDLVADLAVVRQSAQRRRLNLLLTQQFLLLDVVVGLDASWRAKLQIGIRGHERRTTALTRTRGYVSQDTNPF